MFRRVLSLACVLLVVLIPMVASAQKAPAGAKGKGKGKAKPAPPKPTLFPVEVNGRWGFIDKSGTLVIDPRFDQVGDFSYGLARAMVTEVPSAATSDDSGAQEQELWGYIDTKGKWAIKPKYERLDDSKFDYSEGVAFVIKANKIDADTVMAISKTGKRLFNLKACWSEPFNKGHSLAYIDDRFGVVNKKGKLVVKPIYKAHGEIADGLIRVFSEEGFWGYINPLGKKVIKPRFVNATDFFGGKAIVQEDTAAPYVVINKKGKVLKSLDPELQEVGSFREGLARFKKGKQWGYLAPDFSVAIEAQFDAARNFSSGMAAVAVSSKWAFIDPQGNFVLKPVFDDVKDFQGDLAEVSLEGKRGYIDKSGIAVWGIDQSRIAGAR